ncbi:MAG: DUF3047 domain-containing protein [Gemmatimonadota bacterium]
MDSSYARWRALFEERESLAPEVFSERADSLVADLFGLDSLSARVLGAGWDELTAAERAEFTAALAAAVRADLVPWLGRLMAAGRLPLAPVDEVSHGASATLTYSIPSDDGERLLTLRGRETPGGWKLMSAALGDDSLVTAYRARARKLLDETSFPYLVAALGGRPFVVLEDFEASPIGELPVGWSWRARDDDKPKPYRVREENGNRYLEATDRGESVILAKDIKWDLNEYPYVSFRWRARRIPKGGDERFDEKVDSAAGVYFVYRRKMLGLIPESVKYVWSSTLPVGSATRRQGKGRPWMVVAESGEEHLGEWRTYVFDLRAAYEKTFGGKPPKRPLGIAILSDANSTRSRAYADYDDIRALRTADGEVTSGVQRILEANPR